MDFENWEKCSKDCTVCGSAVEVGSASSRCSNRYCPTRDRNVPLSTDSDAQDVYEYYESKDTIEREAVDEAARDAYTAFRRADDPDTMRTKEDAVKALIPLSSYSGFGDIKEDVQ